MRALLAMIRPAVYGIFDHVSIVLNQRLCMQPSYSNMFQSTSKVSMRRVTLIASCFQEEEEEETK